MAWNFTQTDSIAGFVAAIYGKGLNFIRTDSATDPITAIYSIAGAHLGFSEGRGPNFRKGESQYKNKKETNISHISVITF